MPVDQGGLIKAILDDYSLAFLHSWYNAVVSHSDLILRKIFAIPDKFAAPPEPSISKLTKIKLVSSLFIRIAVFPIYLFDARQSSHSYSREGVSSIEINLTTALAVLSPFTNTMFVLEWTIYSASTPLTPKSKLTSRSSTQPGSLKKVHILGL